ncbi:MAG TPA: IPT/TIG domain-containing protein [Terracidiphilus sp.]|nr:IPT/TIG domain-containing protein [Terracidiphilus sp.]
MAGSLNTPTSVAVDGSGDIYFAVEGSSQIYEMVAVNGTVPASPSIRSFGSGFGGVSFLALDASGNLYVADYLNNAVKEVLAVNGTIPAVPAIVTLGSGFNGPAGVAVDGEGDVFVTGFSDNTVKEIVAVNGSIAASPTIQELGSGFQYPIGVAVDADGNVYVADSGNNAVKELVAINGSIPTSPTIKTLSTSFDTPYGITVDGVGNVYVADYRNNAVEEIEAVNGSIPTSPVVEKLGSGFDNPSGVAVDEARNVYVADFANNRVVKLDFADPPSLTFASTAIGSTSTNSPQTITIENAGNAPLTFSIPADGSNPYISANFALGSGSASDCPLLNSESADPATLAAGASCQLPISFTPTAVGALAGSLLLTDNNLNAAAPNYASQNIALSGTGTSGFTITNSAPSLTLNQGGSVTSTITVTGPNGFNGSVNLTASGLPSGVTLTFSPGSVGLPGNGTSTMTLTAAQAVATGKYSISVTGTAGNLTQTTVVPLTVIPPPDFSISTNYTNGQITEGSSGTFTIYSNYANGFNAAVVLSATALPAGDTITLSPATIPAPGYGTSTATVVVGSNTTPGVYPITITGTGGGITHSVTYTLTIPTPSLTLYVSPASAYQGGTSSLFVQAVGSNGFNSAIAFSLSGLPAGVSYSPLSFPAPGNGEGYINMSVASTTVPGTYPITITAVEGSVPYTTSTVNLTVLVPPNFSLAASLTSLTVYQGGSSISTITSTVSGGFNSSIGLNTTGPGTFGINVNFTPQSLPAPGSGTSIVTIGVAPFVQPGTYTIDISGIGGNIYQPAAASIQLTVLQAPSFDSVDVGSTTTAIPFVFTFTSPVILGTTSVLTQGATGQDFTDAGTGSCAPNTPYSQGQACTINVSFSPKITGTRYGAAVLMDTSGNVIATDYIRGTGIGPQLNFPTGAQTTVRTSTLAGLRGIAIDSSGNVYIADTSNNRVLKETPTADGYSESTVSSDLESPQGVAVDGAGNLYIGDITRLLKEVPTSTGYVESVVAAGLGSAAVAVDSGGDIYIVNSTVYELPNDGAYHEISTWGSGFNNPSGVAVDNSGNIFVADTGNNAVKEVLASGSTVTLLSGLSGPKGLALDGQGNLYVSDAGNNRVLELLKVSGYATVVTMPGIYSAPNGVAVSGVGNLYVANSGTNLVTMEDFVDPPNLTFAGTAIGSTGSNSPQTVTVENVGNADLSFPVPPAGVNPSIGTDFTLDGNAPNACLVISSGSSAGTVAAGASCVLSISFTPTVVSSLNESLVLTDNNLNAGSPNYASQSIRLTGTGLPATPSITWTSPGAITYGTALSAAQLNATASVPGTFTYSPAAGAVLNAGTQTLTVTFTPNDTTDYTTATASVPLTVAKAALTITASNVNVTYNQPIPALTGYSVTGFVNGDTQSVLSGTPSESTTATQGSPAGTYPITIVQGTLNAANYNFTLANGTLTITASAPAIGYAQVASADPQTPSATVSVAYPSAQTAGDMNVVAVGWNDTTSTVQSVTDSAGNKYSLAVGPTTGRGLRQSIYYAPNIVAGANTVTVTFNQAAAYPDVRILEYKGVTALDATAVGAGSGTTASTGSASTSTANELIFAADMISTTTKVAGTGFTARVVSIPDSDIAEDEMVTTAGSYSATATLNSSGAWVMQMVTFAAVMGPAPTVTGVSPNSGTTAGGTSVTITGTNFVSGATVTIGGAAATNVTVVNSTKITATTPAGTASAAAVTVTVGGQSGSLPSGFTYLAPPTVTSLSPSSGPLAGGTSVTITGTNFASGTTVTFGGAAATNITVVNSTTITATTPAGSAGAATVTVTNSNGLNGNLTSGFTYVSPPTVTGVSPNSGSTSGGTSVTITGTNFTSGATVTFGSASATNVVVVNSTTITATAPAGSAGAVTVTVTVAGQSGSISSGFTYALLPTVSSVSASSGPVAGGTSVTITGTNFASGATVMFGSAAATNVVVVNSTTITAITPAGAAGTVTVSVTVNGQSGSLANGFTYIGTPTLTSVSPNNGPVTGGTSVTITGTNFATGATVTFGSAAATNVVVVNSTTITAITPVGSVGAVTVTVTNAGNLSGSLASGFTYNASVAIGFAQVAYSDPQTSSATVSVTYPSAQIAGDMNIVVVGWNDTTSTVQSVTDSAGNNYSLAIGPTSGSALRQSIYYAPGIAAGSNTVTVTFSKAAAYPDIRILEYKGVTALDMTAAASGSGTTASTGSVTTTSANELIFAADTISTTTKAAGTGFTARVVSIPDSDLAEDEVATSAGSYNATATLNSSGAWVIQIVSFK